MDPKTSNLPQTTPGPSIGPRPEAAALKWSDLLPNTQRTMEGLINWLHCAYTKSPSAKDTAADGLGGADTQQQVSEEQLATSLLVSGDRGYGKTTILLTSAYALRKPTEFLPLLPGDGEPSRTEGLRSKLKDLEQRIIWLDTLDMEPLPTDANILATLLVRVRNALDLTHHREGRWVPPSLLEEGIDDPYGRIDKLVRDATFMWEESPSERQDPRQRTEQQIKAAEIYASFRRDFFGAMESVSRLLAARNFGHNTQEKVLLVLPIDNVDRSPQHLGMILKLTRMVASRRLWFVLASGRSEFQLFLERTFQKELADAGQVTLGTRDREELLSIARRQAAAAMRRVLPHVHRIPIDQVTPLEAWKYRAPALVVGDSQGEQRLFEFLRELPLACRRTGSHGMKSFADLFDISGRLRDECADTCVEQAPDTLLKEYRIQENEGPHGEAEGPVFTYAARLALTQSARTALELWQSAQGKYQQWKIHTRGMNNATEHSCEDCEELSIEIAESMLRAAIDESDLPGWASEQLLNRIMRRNMQGRIVLDLSRKPIRRLKVTALSDVLWHPTWTPQTKMSEGVSKEGGSCMLRTELHLRHFKDDILELHDQEESGRRVPLPPLVAGWFMLLHDLLVFSPNQRVLNVSVTPYDTIPAMAVTLHMAQLEPIGLAQVGFWWLPPSWDTFIDFAIFTAQWKTFVHRVREHLEPRKGELADRKESESIAANRFAFLLAAWIDNVCSVASDQRGGWCWRKLTGVVPRGEGPDGQVFKESELPAYVSDVSKHVNCLFAKAADVSTYARLAIAKVWLDQALPLLLKPEFIPDTCLEPLKNLRTQALLKTRWDDNAALVEASRRELVLKTLRDSEAGQQLWGTYSAGTGDALAVREWLQEARDHWLELMVYPSPRSTPPAKTRRRNQRPSQRKGR
ncbi:MAG: hypothetical protein JXB05_19825 [Myxococcaceae bacterium]|nr:hypothetical protein [Myxococcaceae bacterium]